MSSIQNFKEQLTETIHDETELSIEESNDLADLIRDRLLEKMPFVPFDKLLHSIWWYSNEALSEYGENWPELDHRNLNIANGLLLALTDEAQVQLQNEYKNLIHVIVSCQLNPEYYHLAFTDCKKLGEALRSKGVS